MGQAQGNPIGVAGWADSAGQRARRMRATRRVATWGDAGRVHSAARRRGSVAAERCTAGGRSVSPAARSGSPAARSVSPAARSVSPAARSISPAARSGSPAARSGSPAGRGSIGAGDHRQGVGSIGRCDPPAGRGQHRGGAIPWQGVAATGRRDPLGRAWQHRGGAIPRQGGPAAGRAIHRQGVASSRQRITGSRAASIRAARSPWQGGQGLRAAKSSRAKDESPTGILSTHVHVADEKNFFTPRRGVILAEKRPFPAQGRKPCYDFCVGRESPPAKQKLHSADHGAERISP